MAIATKVTGTDINWGTLSGHTGVATVVGVALYTAITAGTMELGGTIGTPRPVLSGDSFKIVAGALTFTLAGASGGVEGDTLAKATLDALLGSTTLGPGTYYAALMTAMPTGVGGGTEFPATGVYVRIAVTNNSTNFPAAAMV
jgi:hypothetical protein